MNPNLEIVKEDYAVKGGLKISEVDAWGEEERDIYTAFLMQMDVARRKNPIETMIVRDIETGQRWACTVGLKPEKIAG